ncbi:hypothetical protein [Nereida sp. MMG025]|uniref:hypothetical protein n=1 Tax=Nereida sp. MMG025 TaxID=2909981 RepID=UPI001F22FB06|nr:hypothetical protein [Nereida sp. MMG025]MCF6444994.1 hypothetical protein [Nereida sp. MMG025]
MTEQSAQHVDRIVSIPLGFGRRLAIIIGVMIIAMGGAALAKGGLYVGKHEGDMMHLLEITLRMAQGQIPHEDFMTPIGALAFWPILPFLNAGWGIGMSLMASQILVACILAPAVWWAARSRLTGLVAYGFVALCMALILALVHGEAERSVSFSMHYNRWAWVAAFVAVLVAVLPAKRSNPAIDGIVVGLMMAALVMIKATYFIAFAPAVIIGFLQYKQAKALGLAVVTGVFVAAAFTLLLGFDFWAAYVTDLLSVSVSEVRSAPGDAFAAVMAAPAYLGASLALLLGVIFLRQSKRMEGGLLLLILAPGFWYVTYQNFGNDPQWLPLLAVILFALRPANGVVNGFGWDMRQAVTMTAVAAICFGLPSVFNLLYSPFRHLNVDGSEFTAVLPQSAVHDDFLSPQVRVEQLDARIQLDNAQNGLPAYEDREGITEWNGEVLPYCTLELGMTAWFQTIADDLTARGYAGTRIFSADLFSSFWLFGDFKPLLQGAPWYYGGLPGLKTADYMLIPLCPGVQSVRHQILETVEKEGLTFREVERTPNYILVEKTNG